MLLHSVFSRNSASKACAGEACPAHQMIADILIYLQPVFAGLVQLLISGTDQWHRFCLATL